MGKMAASVFVKLFMFINGKENYLTNDAPNGMSIVTSPWCSTGRHFTVDTHLAETKLVWEKRSFKKT